MTWSYGTKLHILVSKLSSGTSITKAGALFCTTCSPVYVVLYHVTRLCKGPICIIFFCIVSFVMYITGAKFEDPCSNISGDILNSVFYRFSGTIHHHFPHLHNTKPEYL